MRVVAIAALGLLGACQQPVDNSADNAATNTAAAAPAENGVGGPAIPVNAPPTKEAALKLMHDRHENMEKIGDATKAVGRTLKSGAPDIAVIRASAATIAGLAPKVPSWFPPGTGPDVGKTEALPAIWEKPDDFAQKNREFAAAAKDFDAAAKAGDMAAIQARFGALGKTCKGCHDPYREEH